MITIVIQDLSIAAINEATADYLISHRDSIEDLGILLTSFLEKNL